MVENSFLDKGLILGYCFFTDTHHRNCRTYIESRSVTFYVTKQVEDIFRNAKESIIKNHRRAIFDFIAWVTSKYSGTLTIEDIAEIQGSVDRYENDAWRYLLDYFDGKEGEKVERVTKDLRNLIRDIEQIAEERNDELNKLVLGWKRFASYPELEDSLSSLREKDPEDFGIVLDAHDLALFLDGKTELATTNPAEFADETIQSEILEHTAIDGIRLVHVSRSYSPGN